MTSPTHPPPEGAAPAPGPSGHIELVERYFDDNAKDWSDLYGKAKRVNDLVLAARRDSSVDSIEKHVAGGGRIMDAGCGAGLTSLELLRRGFSVHLVDVSSQMLGHAEKNLSQANIPRERYELTRTDPSSGELGLGVFDGIAALGFLQYQSDEVAVLRALHDMLRPGGTLVVTGPTKTRLAEYFGLARFYYKLRRKLTRRRKTAAPTPEEIAAAREAAASRELLHTISAHSYSFGRFRKLLEAAGFEVLEKRGHGFVNFSIIGPYLGFKGELFLHRFFTGLSKVLPISRWANDLIVVARRR